MTATTGVFDLPDRLAAKADSSLISIDERHFATIAAHLEQSAAEVAQRLDDARTLRTEAHGEALERDMEIRRLSGRLRTLRRYGLDLCLGRMVMADDVEPVYVGRLGLTDAAGNRLLIDWRSPAAEPFFGATHANPMGLVSRRRYRWTRGRISDYWDEVFTPDLIEGGPGIETRAALDDQSAFIASLGSHRTARMRDVLGTIQADQDAIIRADSRGALVVDGGPGTGKTVVALHRSAYLVYSDPRLSRRHGGVLFIGPHPAYLAYVADVLPNLGDDEVRLCTLRDLVPEGAAAAAEPDVAAAELKASSRMGEAIEAAVRYFERPPSEGMDIETDVADIELEPADWAAAFSGAELGASHNEAREQVWRELVAILVAKADVDDADEALAERIMRSPELRSAFNQAWPLLDPAGVVGDLWSVPAFLRVCAPWLDAAERALLLRTDRRAWTAADLPLLDVARQRIGDPESARHSLRKAAALAEQRKTMSHVIDDLMLSQELDDGDGVVTMLRQPGLQDALIDESALPAPAPDELAGPFAHIVVDEAQELTDAEWQMLLRRCPSRSFTVVGDRAQARRGFSESWEERLGRIGLVRVTVASLTINYRTPEEVMAEAEPEIRAALPGANVPTSVRSSGVPVVHGKVHDLPSIVGAWLAAHDEGIACVIAAAGATDLTIDVPLSSASRIRLLTPQLAKGLEFDLVVLVDPQSFGDGIEGAVDRYVAMTRATQQLVVLTSEQHVP